MLLIPFVENSFKHGLGKNMDKGYVRVKLEASSQKLDFSIANSKSPNGSEITKQKGYQGGIGLQNVKKRLNLLYPKKHLLTVDNGDLEFSVHLNISLTN